MRPKNAYPCLQCLDIVPLIRVKITPRYTMGLGFGLQGVLHQKLGQHLTAISFLRQSLDLLDGKPPAGMLPTQVRMSFAISLTDQQQRGDAITVATENLSTLDHDPRVLRKETVILGRDRHLQCSDESQ